MRTPPQTMSDYLPIVYDGEVISYPTVQEAITGGTAQISGMKTYEDAETLATQIRIGSLSLKLQSWNPAL